VAPYAVMKGNEMHGVDVDIWNTAAKVKGLTLTYVQEVTFDNILDKVKNILYVHLHTSSTKYEAYGMNYSLN